MTKPLAIDLYCGLGGYYVYEHWRPDRDECFYIGKGKGGRSAQFRHGRNRHYRSVVAKLSGLGMCVEVRMVASGLTESEAFALEIERIAFWRSLEVGIVNLTNGGEGPSGYKQTIAHREKNSQAAKAYLLTPEGLSARTRALAVANAANAGRPVKDETKLKMSNTRKSMARTPSQLALGLVGANKTPEHIAAIVAGKAKARQRRLAAEAAGVADAREAQRRDRRSFRAAERYRLKMERDRVVS